MNVYLQISDSVLICSNDQNETRWSIKIADIILIAEYTTNEGPYADDYFLIFVTNEDGCVFFSQCTFYAESRDAILAGLEKQIGSPLHLGLCHSTQWTSRVMWPKKLEDAPYFEFNKVRTNSFGSRFRKSLFGPQYEYAITDQVREYINTKTAPNDSLDCFS